jgi:hypothetical protein
VTKVIVAFRNFANAPKKEVTEDRKKRRNWKEENRKEEPNVVRETDRQRKGNLKEKKTEEWNK